MKKFLALISAFVLIFSVCACGKTDTTEQENKTSENTEEFSEEAFLEEARQNVVVLNECVLELFGAEYNFEEDNLALYKDEASYANGEGEVAKLISLEEEKNYPEYFVDPTYCSYYPVSNFKTNDEVREYLRNYLSDDVINEYFHNDFLEYEGNLYLRRGARGYGAVEYDTENIRFAEEKDGKYYIEMDVIYFGEYDYTELLELERIDGKLIITDEIQNDENK